MRLHISHFLVFCNLSNCRATPRVSKTIIVSGQARQVSAGADTAEGEASTLQLVHESMLQKTMENALYPARDRGREWAAVS